MLLSVGGEEGSVWRGGGFSVGGRRVQCACVWEGRRVQCGRGGGFSVWGRVGDSVCFVRGRGGEFGVLSLGRDWGLGVLLCWEGKGI